MTMCRSIEEDRELCAKATPGPWTCEKGEWDCERECEDIGGSWRDCTVEKENSCPHYRQYRGADVPEAFTVDMNDYCGLSDDNAAFIAAAREALPHYIDRAEEAEARCDELNCAVRSATARAEAAEQRVTELEDEIAKMRESRDAARRTAVHFDEAWRELEAKRVAAEVQVIELKDQLERLGKLFDLAARVIRGEQVDVEEV